MISPTRLAAEVLVSGDRQFVFCPPAGPRHDAEHESTLRVQTYATEVLPRLNVAPCRRATTAAAVLCAAVCVACASSGGRPATPATLQITTPAPNAVTGPDVDVRLLLAHAHLVPPSQVG